MTPIAATEQEFADFLLKYGFSAEESERPVLLAKSFAFLSSLSFCTEGSTVEGQLFIAMALADGSFDPFAVSDGRVLIKEGLGRNAIMEEFAVANDLSGTDSISQLKRVPMAYNALAPLLCTSSVDGPRNFELIR